MRKLAGMTSDQTPIVTPRSRRDRAITSGVLLLVVLAGFAWMLRSIERPTQPEDARAIHGALGYLNEIEGVTWWRVESTDVVIGFADGVDDCDTVLRGAAAAASKGTVHQVTIWGVPEARRDWKPGDSGAIRRCHGRNGQVKD